jgi:membrane-associated phospholipid phosphatase
MSVILRINRVLGLSRVSRSGFGRAAGNIGRVLVLLGTLLTLWLARGTAPVWFLLPAVALSLVAVYVIDRRSGRFRLWAAYLIGFVLFALLRTVSDETGIPVKAGYVVDAERSLFGGTMPQHWLQQHLYHAGAVSPLDVFVVAVIFSYFVVPHLIALVLWQRDLPEFRRYCPAVLLTVYTGLVVSFLVPTAPPWLANRFTDAPPVARVDADVLHWNPEDIRPGSSSTGLNAVAAMPSLHFAMTTLVVIVLWRHRFLRVVALLYAAAMAFSLVYGGEHYVIDELAGAAMAAVCWLVATRLTRPRTALRLVPTGAPAANSSPPYGN